MMVCYSILLREDVDHFLVLHMITLESYHVQSVPSDKHLHLVDMHVRMYIIFVALHAYSSYSYVLLMM